METTLSADALTLNPQPTTLDDRGRLSIVNPIEYPDWDSLVAKHSDSSFFHTAAWARVLHETYGHTQWYFCRITEGGLEALLPVMEVSSRWTGRRGVSLPFTDFCGPLKQDGFDAAELYQAAMQCAQERGWKYFECRSNAHDWPGSSPSLSFYSHVIDLRGSEEAMFNRCDSAVRRGIRKAEAAGLQVEFSRGAEAMRDFYALHCTTRQRHGLPPQPFRFLENIQQHVLEQDRGFIVTARHGQRPVAAAVFFHFGMQAIYKFGASAYSAQNLRPNNLVMWSGLQRCAELGMQSLHLGRTSRGNEGLRRFKLGFGAQEEQISYAKYDFRKGCFVTDVDRAETWVNNIFRCLPTPFLRLAGRMLYPHLS